MADILQLRVHPDELDQLCLCQAVPRTDGQAGFTVRGPETIWPVASWGETPLQERINVRGWFPLLDEIADEFLIWRPNGGCFTVTAEGARYRVEEHHRPGVEFLQFELSRPVMVLKPNAGALSLTESAS